MAYIKDMERYFDDLEKCANYINSKDIEYGYPTRKLHSTAGVPIAQVAAWQEDGVKSADGGWRIPPRRFMTYAGLLVDYANWDNLVIDAVMDGAIGDTKAAYRLLAEHLANAIREAIIYGTYTPLRPMTIALKGHSDPLLDTEEMYDAATYKIVNAGGII